MTLEFAKKVKMYNSPLMKGCYDLVCEDLKIRCTIARFGKEVNIQAIISYDQGKGNCQKFVREFKKDMKSKGLKLVSSTSINPAWSHICKKLKLKIYE